MPYFPNNWSFYGGNSAFVVVVIAVVVILFLLFREVVCWYYKINKILETMREQSAHLLNLQSVISEILGKQDAQTELLRKMLEAKLSVKDEQTKSES
jgi:hypothetical protein